MAQPLFRQAEHAVTDSVLAQFPPTPDFDTFIEPFLGSGAVFFAAEARGLLEGKLTLLGDADHKLIRLLTAVRAAPGRVYRQLVELGEEMVVSGDPHEYYRMIQSLWNLGTRKPEFLLFLRCCSNGLWRISPAGELHTDWNKRVPPHLMDLAALEAVAAALARTELLAWDFRRWEPAEPTEPAGPADGARDTERAAVKAAHASGDGSVWIGSGTVVYLDPPCIGGWTSHRPGGSGSFTAGDHEDAIRLAALWSQRGARVIYSQTDTPEARRCLTDLWPKAAVEQLTVHRAVGGRAPEILAVGGYA